MLKGRKVYLREYRKEDIVLAHEYINDYEVKRMLVPGSFSVETGRGGKVV